MLRLIAVCLLTLSSLWAGTHLHAQERAKLPRVLILGDSISLGYTPSVKKHLAGKAEVLRPAENCQHTGHGLVRIKTWLGDTKWDVIHFNWGIWDTHMLNAQNQLVKDNAEGVLHIRHTPKQYRENLTKLVETMEKSGAKLIWVSTTPIMSRTGPRFDDIKTLNAVAEEIMKERKIAVNDLYAHVLPNVKEWQSGDKVHFTGVGSDELGKKVSAKILEVLKQESK